MTFWLGKSVLVAGGAGFVGHHLVEALLHQQAQVHVVDNLSTGRDNRLTRLLAQFHNRLSLEVCDVVDVSEFPKAYVVFNLASPASPIHYQADPIATWKTNVIGTMRLIEHAVAQDACFVQASTSEVYGDPLSHPQRETDWGNVNPIGVRACYDEGKRAAEALLMDAVRVHDANVRIARIFNTYGPGMDHADGRAIPNFVAQASLRQPLTLCGDGSQTRSFCYISDTVSGLLKLAEVPEARGEVINIGNPHEVTIKEIADHLNRIMENPAGTVTTPERPDDPVRRCPDIDKARRILGWAPEVALDEGLRSLLRADHPALVGT
ncbi:MAG: NAD-dependent epimerase/dehydratase family protein [Pseudomonadota bacterium]